MDEYIELLTVLLALLTGVASFFVAYYLVVQGMTIYREQFLSRVGVGLKESFLFVDAKTLFVINIIAILIAAFAGYAFAGFIGLIVAVIIIAAIPNIMLRLIRRRRSHKFVYQLPDVLGSMASSLRAGTSLPHSMEQIATQYPPPASQEFAIVLSESRMGRSLDESISEVYRRVPKPEVELFNSAVSISRLVGGNLADTFDTLSETVREKLRVEGKIESLTAMARMQGWVIGLLPIFVGYAIYKQEPEAMSALFTEFIGWLTLAVLSVMMVAAIFVVRKIVNIQV